MDAINNRFQIGDRVQVQANHSGFGRTITGVITHGPTYTKYRTVEYGLRIDPDKNQPPSLNTMYVNQNVIKPYRDMTGDTPYGIF